MGSSMTWHYVGLNWVKALNCPRLAGPDWSRRLLGCLQYGCFVSVFMGKKPRKSTVPIASKWESVELELCTVLPNDLDLAQVLSLQSRSRDTGSSNQCSTFWLWLRCIMMHHVSLCIWRHTFLNTFTGTLIYRNIPWYTVIYLDIPWCLTATEARDGLGLLPKWAAGPVLGSRQWSERVLFALCGIHFFRTVIPNSLFALRGLIATFE